MKLEIELTSSSPHDLSAKTPVAVFVYAKPAPLPAWTRDLGSDLNRAMTARWNNGSFCGDADKSSVVVGADGAMAVLIGLGKRGRLDPEAIRRAYGLLIGAARSERISKLAAPLLHGPDPTAAAEAAAVGAHLANYLFSEYRSDSTKLKPQIGGLLLWEPNAVARRKAQRGIDSGTILAEATCRVRDLVNTPANDLTPKIYTGIAAKWCKDAGVRLQILGPAEITRAGMGAVMAVGGGSANEPRFLIAQYTGRKRQPKNIDVALVGKGVTFDTGGISIKPSADMWEMRGDMMGSAVVLTSIWAAAKLKLPVNLVCLTPLVENMPSGTAYRPGDIVRTLSGQTIEIISTDAEGRMILADALTYSQKYNPKVIVDFATLTGAVAVALGDVCCGLFTESEPHARAFAKASALTGERAWRLPLYADYDEKIASDVADMRNSGGRYGGGSTAARLLCKFTGSFPWVHIDIAGVDLEKSGRVYCPKGASGFGARLLLEFLRGL